MIKFSNDEVIEIMDDTYVWEVEDADDFKKVLLNILNHKIVQSKIKELTNDKENL